eukprot:UN04577
MTSATTSALIIVFTITFSIIKIFLHPFVWFYEKFIKTKLYNFCVLRHRAPLVHPNKFKDTSVAVIGGGIAGVSAAWILSRLNIHVELFEKKGLVGGNATTIDWDVNLPTTTTKHTNIELPSPTQVQKTLIRTGLSVLAWPTLYFRNYIMLLKRLGVSTTSVELPFTVGVEQQQSQDDDETQKEHKTTTTTPKVKYFQNDNHNSELYKIYRKDIDAWLDLIDLIRAIGNVAHGTDDVSPTLYAASILNPFNYISLSTMMKLYGISQTFYDDVFVAVYSSSFLTADISDLPAIIAPIIHDIIPLNAAAKLDSWVEDSSVVFNKMLTEISAVHVNAEIVKVDISQQQTTMNNTNKNNNNNNNNQTNCNSLWYY